MKGGTFTKLFKKLTIALSTLATAIAISTTALAVPLANMGQTGKMVTPKYGAKAYGWDHLCDIDVTWLLEAYVAVTDDGKIDTTQTSLTSSKLDNGNIAFVGGLLYTQGLPANCIIQTSSTTSKRSSGPTAGQSTVYTGSNSVAYRYQFPRTSATDNIDAPFMNLSQGNIHYYDDITNTIRTAYFIGDKTANGLPSSISGSLNYATQIDGVINDPQFCIDVVRDLLGAFDANGESLSSTVTSLINKTVFNKVNEYAQDLFKSGMSKEDAQSTAVKRLYPDSSDPLVQWCVVATPMAVNEASDTPEAFWIVDDYTTGWEPHLAVVTSTDYGGVAYLMDAYTQTWYNKLTHVIFKNDDYRYSLWDDYGVPLEYLENGSSSSVTKYTIVNDGTPVQGSFWACKDDWGQLRKEYEKLYYNLAECSQVDSKDANTHLLGINEPSGTNWSRTSSDYATIGGITIALSEFDAPDEIPVYYYITPDPNEPTQTDPKSVPVDKPFTPNPPPGTKVKKG